MSSQNKSFPVTEDQIDAVVQAFYAKIRVHPTLGPIFKGAIGTNDTIWGFHEDKIGCFWRSVLLREGSYNGSPVAIHLEVPGIMDEHFTQWLELFDSVLQATLPQEAAAVFSAKAHKIGGGLRRSVGIMNGYGDVGSGES